MNDPLKREEEAEDKAGLKIIHILAPILFGVVAFLIWTWVHYGVNPF